jgi:hypothetical protein
MLKRSIQFFALGLLTFPALAFAAGIVQLPATNQVTCFGANGVPRACADTGEDAERRVGVAWPALRFTDNGNGTVTDNLTALVWSKHANAPNRALPTDALNACPNAQLDMTWQQALDFIVCLNAKAHAGFSDWRLPNLNELESMVNAEVPDTSVYLNANGFGFPGDAASQVHPSQYWSSTSDASNVPLLSPAAAWDMDFVKGDFPVAISKTAVALTRGVWPVRGVSALPAQLWRTGQTLCFDEAGATRPCAGTGEDGELLAGAAWPVPRFKLNVAATFALDRVSGLVWPAAALTPGPAACSASGTLPSWQLALDHVACLNLNTYLGLSDWRLPNRKELHSLADYSIGSPALPAGHPFSGLSALPYWSSTTNAATTSEAWGVSTVTGALIGSNKANARPVLPVSGPDLIPPVLTLAQTDLATNIPIQTLSGTVEADATVTAAINGGAPVPASVTGTNWTFSTGPLAGGLNNVTVMAADFSENLTTAPISITLIIPDGILLGGSTVQLGDALQALRMAVGLVAPTADELLRGDVEPVGAPDGAIGVPDALLILRKVVGLSSF